MSDPIAFTVAYPGEEQQSWDSTPARSHCCILDSGTARVRTLVLGHGGSITYGASPPDTSQSAMLAIYGATNPAGLGYDGVWVVDWDPVTESAYIRPWGSGGEIGSGYSAAEHIEEPQGGGDIKYSRSKLAYAIGWKVGEGGAFPWRTIDGDTIHIEAQIVTYHTATFDYTVEDAPGADISLADGATEGFSSSYVLIGEPSNGLIVTISARDAYAPRECVGG